jgi:hypothetical protein
VPRHDREADALAEPCIANRECRRLFDRIMPQRERLDGGRMMGIILNSNPST